MYIPKINKMHGDKEAFAFMQKYSFATLVTSSNTRPSATHLPFVVEKRDEKIYLKSHFAKANQQWKEIETKEVLVIFNEPHAYISPKNYEKKINVPTWNYLSVHAYGKCKIISDYPAVIDVLENTITYYEKTFINQWNTLPEDYKIRMCKGIVAFEIEVLELQAKKKISQDKTEVEKKNIINNLESSGDMNDASIAKYMKKNLNNQ